MKALPTQYECLKMIRKQTPRPGFTFKMKTKYSRKQKHAKGAFND